MVRVGISVEGSTEERFIEKVLLPYFNPKNIFLTPVSLGGNVSIDRIGYELNKLLFSFDHVSTFYDFYGFKKKQVDETKSSLEKRILNTLGTNRQKRCIPYVQMYEFEGLLFSSPEAIASVLEEYELKEWAQEIVLQFGGNPEGINDSPQTAPSKRLAMISYRKITHGPNIAKEIGLNVLRKKCAGFGNWLTTLEALQR